MPEVDLPADVARGLTTFVAAASAATAATATAAAATAAAAVRRAAAAAAASGPRGACARPRGATGRREVGSMSAALEAFVARLYTDADPMADWYQSLARIKAAISRSSMLRSFSSASVAMARCKSSMSCSSANGSSTA